MTVPSLSHMHVKEAMTKKPITISPLTTIEKAKFIFDENKIHHLPIVDKEGVLTGIISYSDVLLLMNWGVKYNIDTAIKESNLLLRSQTASDLSSKKIVAVYPEDNLINCYEIFKQKEIRALPVIDHLGKLVGIITPLDIIKILFNNKNT
jgi:acetoin utilization protein AcuB